MLRHLTRLAVVAGFLCFSVSGFSAPYTIDSAHSSINFQIKHMLSKVNGRFTDFTATFDFDPDMKSTGNFKASIKTQSINTDNAKRDKHLRSPDFFNAEKNPEITFNSSKVTKTGKNTFDVVGNLNMAGKTKPVTFKFEYLGEVKDSGTSKAGFVGKTTINRKDFGIVWNKKLDNGGFMLGDEVVVEVLLEAVGAKKSASL